MKIKIWQKTRFYQKETFMLKSEGNGFWNKFSSNHRIQLMATTMFMPPPMMTYDPSPEPYTTRESFVHQT